ncbi:S-adenosyl-L-methionine-dependent methyltransferase [Aspergillus heterothallicus]
MSTTTTSPSPIVAPPHIHTLLQELHKKSLDQEAIIAANKSGKVFSADIISNLSSQGQKAQADNAANAFDALMLDKFIALDEDKCHFTYQLITSMGATNIVEALTGKREGVVIATEKEESKASVAREYWKQCGDVVEKEIDLRVGDLLETLKEGLPVVDLLLLDIWSALALPTLKTVLPRMRPGAVVLADNTISGAKGYAELLAFLRCPENGFQNMTLPFTNGFEMSVYMPNTH